MHNVMRMWVWGLALLLAAGCSTTQRVDALVFATEMDHLNVSWDRATDLIERNVDRLEPHDQTRLLAAWDRLDRLRDMLREERIEALLRHPLEVELMYWEGRAAWSELRTAVAPYLGSLHPQDRLFAERMDRSARRLDAAAVRLLSEAGGEADVVLEMIRLTTATARLAGRLLL